jgi:TRAP-type C4-dicarboxylate transport system permease small subunit
VSTVHRLLHRLLRHLALLFAWLGAAVAMACAVMVVCSVTARALWAQPIAGDVEITQLLIAVALSMCLPWCQWQRANIIVDFFTQHTRPAVSRRLDALGCVLLAAMGLLLAWRTGAGALAVHAAGETSMVLALPMWISYAAVAPGLALASLVALYQAWGHVHLLPLAETATETATETAP